MLPREDVIGCFLLSCMAMMTEAIALMAANRRYRLAVISLYKGQDEPLIPFAELHLTPEASITGDYADEVFLARRTSRLRYSQKPIPPEALQRLMQVVQPFGHVFGYTDALRKIEPIVRWNIEVSDFVQSRKRAMCIILIQCINRQKQSIYAVLEVTSQNFNKLLKDTHSGTAGSSEQYGSVFFSSMGAPSPAVLSYYQLLIDGKTEKIATYISCI